MLSKTIIKLVFFRLSYVFTYVSFIGFSLFIHFSIGHEISVVENWLYHYSGWILIFASLFRLALIFLSVESRFNLHSCLTELRNQSNKIRIEYLFSLLLLSVFFPIYFSEIVSEGAVTRSLNVPRSIVLFFIISLDIAGTYVVLMKKNKTEFIKYGIFDCFFAVLGGVIFFQNLHLNLIFIAFYFSAYFLFIMTRNLLIIFMYWPMVLYPITNDGIFNIDIFSMDYRDIFSVFVVIIAHLITYIWITFVKNGEKYGTKSIRHS